MNAIVTTSINSPTEALEIHASRPGWDLIVVGDTKTPHRQYEVLNCIYLSPRDQESLYPELSDRLGWSTITRRNVGLLYAYQKGYEVVATVDDDNIPLSSWGDNLHVGELCRVNMYHTDNPVLDPMPLVGYPDLWHRGYPWELLQSRDACLEEEVQIRVLVQADLWNGDPDVDATCRMIHKPEVEIADFKPFTSNALMPFNSQNTFLHRTVLPSYMMLSGVGRVQDIWGSYILQHYHPACVIYTPATVYQERNEHDLIKDLEDELLQYRHTYALTHDLPNWRNILPRRAVDDFDLYRSLFSSDNPASN